MKNNDPVHEDFIQLAIATSRVLDRENDLSPRNPTINTQLSLFVGAVMGISQRPGSEEILKDPRIQEIRPGLLKKLSQAEGEMEKYFAQKFGEHTPLHMEDLDGFWYRKCYEDLVQQEIDVMNSIGVNPKKIVMIGAGPLPLTGIFTHASTGADIACVDIDPEAVAMSRKMLSNMGPAITNHMQVHESDGKSFDFTGADLVHIASLVPNKQDVVARVQETAPDAVIGVRSVNGLKAMLYEPVGEKFNRMALAIESVDAPGTINTCQFHVPMARQPTRNL